MDTKEFPTKDQHFGLTHAGGIDGSYRDDIFVCVASDEYRVIGKAITPHWNKDPTVFYRGDWNFQTVDDSLVEAIQTGHEQAA